MAGLSVVVMAAGKGTRMRSAHPKVLHTIAGRSLLQHVLDTAATLGADRTVVVTGHGADAVERSASADGVSFARQEPQLGTGHAVAQAAPLLADDSTTLVLNGDVPLIASTTLRALVDRSAATGSLVVLTVDVADPQGYGRIVRDRAGAVAAIVEEKDANVDERSIREIYTGVLAAPTAALKRWLAALRNDNAAGEYYLTDVVRLAVAEGAGVTGVAAGDETEVLGVNSAVQLADLERRFQRRAAERLMEGGVRLADPARFDLRGELVCGSDVEIDVGCVFEGRVSLGDGVRVGAYCILRDAAVAAGAEIRPYTHVDGGGSTGNGASIGEGASVGPFARLRAGARLGADVHIGNFVEVKNSTLGRGTKANHLAYLGDSTVGERVNFGAGSITANYDGAAKHRTVIGDDASIGSNCVLVAPIEIGAGATIGGGSTISRPAPAGQLTVARARQATIAGWKRPTKPAKSDGR